MEKVIQTELRDSQGKSRVVRNETNAITATWSWLLNTVNGALSLPGSSLPKQKPGYRLLPPVAGFGVFIKTEHYMLPMTYIWFRVGLALPPAGSRVMAKAWAWPISFICCRVAAASLISNTPASMGLPPARAHN